MPATSVSLRTLVIALAFALASGCAPCGERPAAADPEALHAAVDGLLSESAEAWNAGDLDGFLYWYKSGLETTYIGSSGLFHGWDAIRARYAPGFEPGAERDSLRFEGLETRPLGPGLGLATARYVLLQGDSITSEGVFTLVLEETAEGWRIVHDHSSAQTN